MNESLIARIRKLQALADNNTNEAEAALAASRVQDLLMEHGLSMAEIGAASQKSASDFQDGKRVKDAHKSAAMYDYQKTLMATIAANNFCDYWREERWKPDPRGTKARWLYDNSAPVDSKEGQEMGRLVKSHMLLGREENVIASQIMYDYLIDTMDRLLPWQGMQKRGKDALLWLAGCTARLTERLTEIRYQKEREQERKKKEAEAQGQQSGLVLYSDVYASEEDLNDDFKAGHPPGTKAKRRREAMARNEAIRAKIKALVNGGMDPDEAWYVANGWDVPVKVPEVEQVKETEAQRRKREAREARENAQWEARQERRREKEREKLDHPSYRQGMATAYEIGLNDQVKSRQQERIK